MPTRAYKYTLSELAKTAYEVHSFLAYAPMDVRHPNIDHGHLCPRICRYYLSVGRYRKSGQYRWPSRHVPYFDGMAITQRSAQLAHPSQQHFIGR